MLQPSAREAPRTRNGKLRLRTLSDLDQRTAAAKRAHTLVSELSADIADAPSTAQRQLIQRVAIIGALVEHYEAAWVSGEAIPIEHYLAAANTQKRLLCALGLERRARDVTPDLRSYIRNTYASQTEAAP